MDSSSLLLVFGLGYLVFGILVIVWFRKKKKAGRKISGWVKAIVIFIGLMGPSIFLSIIELSPAPETSVPRASTTYYVKAESANVRECPSTSCKAIDSLSQNTPLTFPGDLYNKFPDWVEVTFEDGKLGYVSKTTLSSELSSGPSIKSPPQGSGIALGTGDFAPFIVGYSYGFSFCVPESARSGATCGGLTGATQSPVGGSPPYSLVKGSGFFPPGMSLELNGWFSGSPTTEGTYNFQICAKDLQMNQGCQNYTIVVEEDKPALTPSFPSEPLVPDETPASPPASSMKEVIIDSYACTFDRPYAGNYSYKVSLTGKATAPIDHSLKIPGDSIFFFDYHAPHSCGSWTDEDPTGFRCHRDAGQPETTTFSLNLEFTGNKRPFTWTEENTDNEFLFLSWNSSWVKGNSVIPGGFHCN